MLLVDGPLANEELDMDGPVTVPTLTMCDRPSCLAPHVTYHEYDVDGLWVRSFTTLQLTN